MDHHKSDRIRVVVRGRVQGVGFRAWTAAVARDLGLTGYVLNGPDGQSVELVAEGAAEAIRTLVQYLHHGPPAACVASVTEASLEPDGGREFRGFVILS